MTIILSSKLRWDYIVLFESNVFEEGAVPGNIVLVFIVSDDGIGIIDHVIINVEVIANKIASEG